MDLAQGRGGRAAAAVQPGDERKINFPDLLRQGLPLRVVKTIPEGQNMFLAVWFYDLQQLGLQV